jgi:hypothetical protein
MASEKLPALADFCKQLSREYQQLRLILQVQESFTSSVASYGYEDENRFLLYIIEHLDLLSFKAQQLKGKVQNRLWEYES